MLDRDFGKYRLIKRLGRGGMADVYLARDTVLQRDVALKIVEAGSDADTVVLDTERRGAALHEQFSRVHSHVPIVHEYGESGGYFYLDMEYVEGEDLAAKIARGPLAGSAAASIALEVSRFLESAHRFEANVDGRELHGIIHGDIKPKNIRINREGRIKVLDFGIAKGLSLVRQLTRNDFRSSTYCSPERLETGEVDVHADLWSVGVVLYEMLAGHPPFRAATVEKLEVLIQARMPAPPLPEDVEAGLQRIVFKALAPERARRYQTAADVCADLAAWLDERETRADKEWMQGSTDAEVTRRTRPPVHSAATESFDPEATRLTRDEDTRPTRPTSHEETTRPGRGVSDGNAAGEGARDAGVSGTSVAAGVQPGAVAAGSRVSPSVRRRRLIVAGLAVLALSVFANEVTVWSAARELRSGLPALQPAELDAAWNRYEKLRRRSLLGVAIIGVRRPLKERLVAQAERVISDYRHDAPAVREAHWKQAVDWLRCASRLDPQDSGVLARLRYCEGHLYRIEGESRKRRKQANATRSLHEAIARFEEAGRVDRHWPDPYLGLARTYVYGLDDLDRAIVAFEEAGRRGYRPGLREIAQLADGYRNRADRMRRESERLRGLPQEYELLEKAVNDYGRAVHLYEQAIGFGEASANLRYVQRHHDEVSRRLESYR